MIATRKSSILVGGGRLPLDKNIILCYTAIMKLRKPRITDEQISQVVTDYNAGLKVDDILERNHIARNTLYRILKKTA